MDDVMIIDLFWDRDENAIKMAEQKYHAFCYSIAWKILTNGEDAEECVNDTWYAAWKYIPPQRPPGLAAFLGKITRGFAIDRLRKMYATKRADLYITSIAEEAENLNAAVVRGLDEQMEAEELLGIINRFLGEIPERDRDMFVQRYWLMEPIQNIAARHRTSEGAVKQNLFRSRKKLKKVLEKEGRL